MPLMLYHRNVCHIIVMCITSINSTLQQTKRPLYGFIINILLYLLMITCHINSCTIFFENFVFLNLLFDHCALLAWWSLHKYKVVQRFCEVGGIKTMVQVSKRKFHIYI